MHKHQVLGRSRRLLVAILIGLVAAATVAVFALPAVAASPSVQDPGTVSLTIEPGSKVDGLNGQTINYHINTSSPYVLSGKITTHLCVHNPGGYGTGSFGYGSGNSQYCIYSPGIVAAPPKVGFNGDFEKQTTNYDPAALTTNSGVLSFVAPTSGSSLTWANAIPDGPFTAQADATHGLDLVIQVNLAGGVVPQTYIVQPLTFAGPPGAPTGVTASGSTAATAQDQKTTVSWSAPANTGNGNIDDYIVTATPFTPGGAAITCDAGVATTVVFPSGGAGCNTSLSNFQNYHITVHAHSDSLAGAAGSGPESSPAVDIVPSPPAPTGVQASNGTTGSDANVSWVAPVSSQTVVDYKIHAVDNAASGAAAPFDTCHSGPGTSANITGLVSGHPWVFTVTAYYGGAAGSCTAPFGPTSSLSGSVSPTNIEIDQIITVTRPTGALVLTQACDPSTPRTVQGGTTIQPGFTAGDPYPQKADGTVPDGTFLYPTPDSIADGSCAIPMSAAKLITATGVQGATPLSLGAGYPTNVSEGQFFRSDGHINQVTVVNARDDAQAWTVNGKLTGDFSDGVHTLSGTSLGWVPRITDKSPSFTTPGNGTYTDDAQLLPAVQLNGVVLPASGAINGASTNGDNNQGLSVSRTFAFSPATGLGQVHLDADLHMLIPIQTPHGTYKAKLQITAI